MLLLLLTNNPVDSNVYEMLIKPKTLHKIKIGFTVDLKTDVISIYFPRLKRNWFINLLTQTYNNWMYNTNILLQLL